MLLATINSGTLIIALPDLERSLHTSLLELVWVILVYMIASTVLVLSAGRLSDQFGRKKAYVIGFVVFAAASLGAGFAADGTQLILWRILQGIGGAFLFANAAAIVTDAFPKEQLGLAMGTNTMVAAVGLVIGPVLGGALVAISWHWVFWFNVPFGLAGAVWGALRPARGHRPLRGSLVRLSRDDHVPARPHRPGLRHLQGRDRGLDIAAGDPGADSGRRVPAPVRAHRVAPQGADARPVDLPQPPVRHRLRGRVCQRSVSVRADVPVRLLLPGRAGQLADPGRRQAGAAGAGDARRLAGRRDVGRPPRLAHARGAGDARHRAWGWR